MMCDNVRTVGHSARKSLEIAPRDLGVTDTRVAAPGQRRLEDSAEYRAAVNDPLVVEAHSLGRSL